MSGEEALNGHRPDGTVDVVPHDARWTAQFAAEAHQLKEALASLDPTIEHIGSTSVRGLAAKPTIDILVLVDDVQDVLRYEKALGTLGYDYRPGSLTTSDDQLFFRKVARTGKRTHHLHVVARRSPKGRDYVAFRDYLRSHEQEARAYAAIKVELAEQFANERMRYVDEKARYVDALMERVRAWASAQSS